MQVPVTSNPEVVKPVGNLLSNSDAMMVDDDGDEQEDEVVREIDVFLSPELSTQLYLMQFPLQQRAQSTPEAARIKPRHCMIELDYRTPAEMEEYGQFHMSTRTFSSHTVPISTHMALGKMVDKPDKPRGLHLIPLSRITQMRPSFHHVDDATSNLTTTADDEERQKRAEASTMERKPLTFQKKESERAALARKSSFGYKKTSEESESWQSLDIHAKGSSEFEGITAKIVCTSPEENVLMDSLENENQDRTLNNLYVESLNYLPLAHQAQAKEKGEKNIATVCETLVKLMHQGFPTPYSVIRVQFPKSFEDETILSALNGCTFLVRGNFVLQSRLIPLSPSVARARTFILFLIQSLGIIHRKRLEYAFEDDDEVNAAAIVMILEQVAQKTSDGWILKVEEDSSFAEKFPLIVSIHLEFWKSQVSRFGPLFERYSKMSQT